MTTPTNLEVLENAMKTDTLDQVSPYHLDLYNRSVKHGLITPLQGQKPPTIPIPDKFDPNDVISDMLGDFDSMGDGYDYKTALKHGIVPDDKGKWQSLVPETGQILKGANHSTFDLTVEAERNRGSNIVYDGTGTLYSRSLGALRSDGTEKGTGFRGAHKMTDGSDRIVTDMTVEGGLIVNNRSIEYPLLVPTLNKAEIKILMRGGDIPTSIRKKAIDHAKMRIERGMSQFSNHAPDTQKKFELVESLGDCNDFTDKAFQYGITDAQIVEKIANKTVHWLSDFRNELTEEEMHALIPIIRGFEE